ncbi:WD40/YVTN/BNR-like repeat-containing protein [Longispora albida]|uniref:WD40/YVTN/BNR-like repeat-containing protein n=1 Tax=Longispora albida TaxID=203523 RepID=UPI0003821E05|nr:sialidase family protein [Longispora albida]
MRKLATGVTASLSAALAVLSMSGTATAATTWTINPNCSTVTGPGGLSYTKDDGATIKPTTNAATPITYTVGLAALDTANTLVAVQEKTIQSPYSTTQTVYRSTNAGCTWTSVGVLPEGWFVKVTAAKGGRAYLWSDSGSAGLYRMTGTTITPLTDPTLAEPTPDGQVGHVGLGVDPANGLHVLLAGYDGKVWESFNGGNSWTKRGNGLPGQSFYDVSWDPKNLYHGVAGLGTVGTFYTYDGGQTWSQWTGSGIDLTPADQWGVNILSVAVSPADGNVVYAEGIDVGQYEAQHPSQGRHLWRSNDGGQTWAAVFDQNAEVTLYNGNPLFPHPTDANTLYFTYGTNFSAYGSDLYKYSHTSGTVTKTHNTFHDIDAVAFNPLNANTLYLGLAVEP